MRLLALSKCLFWFGSLMAAAQISHAGIFSRTWGDVIVVTDMTPEGREIVRPTRDNPVYFRGMSLGCKYGSIPGDDLPEEKVMNKFVAKILAKQGYRGARPGVDEPSLFLVVQWGYLRPGSGDLHWFLGYDASQDIGAPMMPGMLGPEVFRRGMRSPTTLTILESASEPIYGIIVTAFEYKSADTPKPVIYWQTRIGLTANGKSMAEALPVMAKAAETSFGLETSTPRLVSADDARTGDVQLGELEVLGTLEELPSAQSEERR